MNKEDKEEVERIAKKITKELLKDYQKEQDEQSQKDMADFMTRLFKTLYLNRANWENSAKK